MSTAASSHPMNNRASAGRIALLVTLGTESIFFLTLLVSYAALRDQSAWHVQRTLARLAFPLVNTAVLLASAVGAGWAARAIRQGRVSALRIGLLVTLLMGLVFVAGQVYEFNRAGLQIGDPAFGGAFFALMGFHAVHVLAGVVFLALNLLRANLDDFSVTDHEAVELGTWFWYYVCAVWVVLFAALYLI